MLFEKEHIADSLSHRGSTRFHELSIPIFLPQPLDRFCFCLGWATSAPPPLLPTFFVFVFFLGELILVVFADLLGSFPPNTALRTHVRCHFSTVNQTSSAFNGNLSLPSSPTHTGTCSFTPLLTATPTTTLPIAQRNPNRRHGWVVGQRLHKVVGRQKVYGESVAASCLRFRSLAFIQRLLHLLEALPEYFCSPFFASSAFQLRYNQCLHAPLAVHGP